MNDSNPENSVVDYIIAAGAVVLAVILLAALLSH